METEGNVRYVIVGSNSTGWAAIARTIRDVDEDKVKDCKEDIDTLLVFTGLFSAVLSAFLIESYQNLSPDPNDTVIQLLGQIATQTSSYTISGGHINSTISPPTQPPPAFEPPLAALRVNQLWFSSLIVTLVTASFGMLVKQWLREYLAVDYTSPHERLRARQFRHPGLSDWKVFEIAGVLPLLLQLALGLFFLGLCFFTWSVNSNLGEVSTVLIGGWAFFFASATVAPLSSPRCPYKTTLLKGFMTTLRRQIRRSLYPTSVNTALRATLHATALGAVPERSQFFRSKYFVEEDEAVKRDADEVEILKEVDAFLLDDELLGTTIFDSLTQNNADPSTVIKFVLQALNNRLKGNMPTQPLTSILDLQRLSKRGWIAVSDIVAATVMQTLQKQTATRVAGRWLEDAIYLLLSLSDQPLTLNAQTALIRCVHKDTMSHFEIVINSLASVRDQKWAHIMSRLCGLCEHLTASDLLPSDAVTFILKLSAFELGTTLSQPLHSVLDMRSLSLTTWTITSNAVGSVILRTLQKRGTAGDTIGPWLEDALHILLSHSDNPITNLASDALLRCVGEDTVSRFGQLVKSTLSPTQPHAMHVTSRIVSLCKLLPTLGLPPQDIVNFAIHAFGDGHSVETLISSSPTSISVLDLRGLSDELWIALSDIAATAILEDLGKQSSVYEVRGGSWLEDALYILLSLANYPTRTTKSVNALVCCIQKSVSSRLQLGRLICSLASPESEHLPHIMSLLRYICESLLGASADPEDVIQFLHESLKYCLKEGPLSAQPPCSVLDLRWLTYDYWVFISDTVATAVLQAFDKNISGQGVGLWLQDALPILLSISQCPITPRACDALVCCLTKNAGSRYRTWQCIRSLAPTESAELSLFVCRVSSICQTFSATNPAFPDVLFLLRASLKSDATEPDVRTPIMDLQDLSQPAWTALSNTAADAVMQVLKRKDEENKDEQPMNAEIGPWLEDAICILLSLSDHPVEARAWDALTCCAEDDTTSHFKQLVESLTRPDRTDWHYVHVLRRLCGVCNLLSGRNTVTTSDIINLLLQPVGNCIGSNISLPLSSISDFRQLPKEAWDLVSDAVAETMLQGLGQKAEGRVVDTWMEGAVYVLLSLSEHPLTSRARDALVRCITEDGIYRRFDKCVRPLASPEQAHFPHILSRLRDISRLLSASRDVEWLLRQVAKSVPCVPQCSHTGNDYKMKLFPVVHDHVPLHEEWARHYLPLIVDRAELILSSDGDWAPGSLSCLRALQSCPVPMDSICAEAPKLIFKLLCSSVKMGTTLKALVSVKPTDHAGVIEHAAIKTLASIVSKADSEGRRKFVNSMKTHCHDFLNMTKKSHSSILDLNVVRLCALISHIHSQIQPDKLLAQTWRVFYAECAKATERFRTTKYATLKDEEKRDTTSLAEQCLSTLDAFESPAENPDISFDEWDTIFDASSSLLPDDLFRELALYVSEDIAIRFKRVKRLRRNGVEREVLEPTASGKEDQADQAEQQAGTVTVADSVGDAVLHLSESQGNGTSIRIASEVSRSGSAGEGDSQANLDESQRTAEAASAEAGSEERGEIGGRT